MSDIAEIGIRFDTSQLEKGEKALNRLPAAAAGASVANEKLAKTAAAAGIAVAAAATAAARAEDQLAKATLSKARASETVSKEEIRALSNARKLATAKLDEAKAHEANVNALNKEATALRRNNALSVASSRPGNSVSGIVSGGRVSGGASSPDVNNVNRFNTGNIAAQFQDIGVTAAMGMNPLQIALQQGTQLSAILQTMENPLKGIAVAFQQIINPISLMAIGFVAVVAALLQFINWTNVAKTALNGLADVMVTAAPYVAILAATLGLLYAPAIIGGIYSLSVAILTLGRTALIAGGQMAAAWLIGLGPIGWAIAAIGALAAAAYALGDDFGEVMAFIARGFELLFPPLMLFREELKTMLGSDVLDAIKDGINEVIKFFDRMFETIGNRFRALKAAIKLDFDEMSRFTQMARDSNPLTGEDRPTPNYVGDIADGVTGLASKAAGGIRRFASGLGKGSGDKKKDPWTELVKGAERDIATEKARAAAIGLSAEAAAKLEFQTKLLNEAQQKNINLTPQQLEKIDALSSTFAKAQTEAKRLQEAYDFLKDSAKTFVSTLRSSLAEGKSIWESFGAAVKGVVDKILDQLLDSQINNLISSVFSPKGGGAGGGGLGSILGGVADFLGLAKGGVVSQNGLHSFAKGGAFTNQIVRSPTLFKFANGGAMGEMGEAGPEAVMPLHRGPDGSLGVKMSGDSSATTSGGGGNTYYIDARGADQGAVERIQQMLMAWAGPGVVERRVINAQTRGAL